MMNILQKYIPGIPFSTYFLSDLTAKNPADWIWHGRTLVKYRTELCSDIQLGGKIAVDDGYERIFGVWSLDRYTLSGSGVTLCCIGQTGRITMSISACNGYTPLADAGHLHTDYINISQTSTVTGFYVGTDLSIRIIPDAGTVIRSIRTETRLDTEFWEDDYVSKQTGHVYADGTVNDIPITATMNCEGTEYSDFFSRNWRIRRCRLRDFRRLFLKRNKL